MTKPPYRQEDADRVWAWLGSNKGTALDIATDLSISADRVKRAIQFIRRTAEYTDGIPITFCANGIYYRTAQLEVAYLTGLVNQARHLATRCETALVEAQRAPNLRSRQPEVMRALFASAIGHLTSARSGLDFYADDLSAIDTLITP